MDYEVSYQFCDEKQYKPVFFLAFEIYKLYVKETDGIIGLYDM